MTIDRERLDAAIDGTREHLLSLRAGDCWWEGRLSSSAVSTATAAMALHMGGADRDLIDRACEWLVRTQNEDGGWGDTPDSPSNIAATLLSICALKMAGAGQRGLARGEEYLAEIAGPEPEDIARAVRRRYGEDRTFQAPILAACAMAGVVPWREVPRLPVDLAALPRSWHRLLRLEVVSYALPALIAVGTAIHRRNPPLNPLTRVARSIASARSMHMLPRLQPESGGFLEAAPLTAFVAMSLLEIREESEVVRACLRFLRETVRDDASWPIDTNLSVWVTTNALMALRCSGGIPPKLASGARTWLLDQQFDERHPFTNAAPGGWPWTHLPGGVPDADDTAGAVLLMAGLGEREAAIAGAFWLVGLHNPDGGWPTFCQGWGRLPFDQSSPDITAHVARALHALGSGERGELHVRGRVEVTGERAQTERTPAPERAGRVESIAMGHIAHVASLGFDYLKHTQREDGAWVPLWFGNQHAPGQRNPVFGTARVLAGWADCARGHEEPARRGVAYLLRAQNDDGGWGGAAGVQSTIEETAMAVSALSRFTGERGATEALQCGVRYLLARVDDDTWTQPAPIGLYFASLWYAEDLYPVAWTVEALGRAREALTGRG